jgi:hypothetical protein
VPRWELSRRFHPRKSGLIILFIQSARLASWVQFDSDVVHRAVAWMKFKSAHEKRIAQRGRDHKIAVKVTPIRREHIRFRHLNDQIRLAELPSFRKAGQGR